MQHMRATCLSATKFYTYLGTRLLFVGLLWAACRARAPEPGGGLAFFHWKNRLSLGPEEVALLDSTECRTLYVKFLDVARGADGVVRPYALLDVRDTSGLGGRQIIPCVFLTNSVFEGLSADSAAWLAERVTMAVEGVGRQLGRADFSEVQFDCDWTARTRAVFFSFLRKMRSLLPAHTRLSATIRLHQYKHPRRTGVPPVDRGLLMLYNTGDIESPDEEHSIFHTRDALRYVEGAPTTYPLPLDVALPTFSWTLIYRDGRLWKIAPEGYAPPPYEGDQRIRTEIVDTALLRRAAQVAARLPLAPDGRVAFFRLDGATARRYPATLLKDICRKVKDR